MMTFLQGLMLAGLPHTTVLAADDKVQRCDEPELMMQQTLSCEAQSEDQVEQQLNEVYRQLLREYADDELFIEKLKQSQRQWLRFRDAELALRFPHADDAGYYGSVLPACASRIRAELTVQRIAHLSRWLEGIAEGDVCSGSIRRSAPLFEPAQ